MSFFYRCSRLFEGHLLVVAELDIQRHREEHLRMTSKHAVFDSHYVLEVHLSFLMSYAKELAISESAD